MFKVTVDWPWYTNSNTTTMLKYYNYTNLSLHRIPLSDITPLCTNILFTSKTNSSPSWRWDPFHSTIRSCGLWIDALKHLCTKHPTWFGLFLFTTPFNRHPTVGLNTMKSACMLKCMYGASSRIRPTLSTIFTLL